MTRRQSLFGRPAHRAAGAAIRGVTGAPARRAGGRPRQEGCASPSPRTREILGALLLAFGLGATPTAFAQQSTCFTTATGGVQFNWYGGTALGNSGSLTFGPSLGSAACAVSGTTGAISPSGTVGSDVAFLFVGQSAQPALVNNGAITINDGGSMQWSAFSGTVIVQDNGTINLGQGGTGAQLTLFDTATFDLTGFGTLTMSNGGKDVIAGGTGAEVLINDTAHIIQGSGTISNLTLINNGFLFANGTAGMTIAPAYERSIVNNGFIQASSAGGLTINFTTIDPSIPAIINNQSVSDSSFIAVNGGGFVNNAGAVTNVTGTGVLRVVGQFTNQSGGTLLLGSGRAVASLDALQNSGIITVGAGSVATVANWLDLGANGMLTGGGIYNLNGGQLLDGGRDVLAIGGGVNLTLAAGGATGLAPDANGSTALLDKDGGYTSALNNLGNIQAGASLTLTGVTQNTTGGLSNGGTLSLGAAAAMTVGTQGGAVLTNTTGGTITVAGGSSLTAGTSGFAGSIGNAGLVTVTGGGALALNAASGSGSIANSGAINLTAGSLLVSSAGGTYLTTLSGGGTITLAAGTIGGTSGTEVFYNKDNSISGYGTIGNLSLLNGGTITASGGPLVIVTSATGSVPDTNQTSGSMVVQGGAAMTWLANNSAGTAFINDGTVTVNNSSQLTWRAAAGATSPVAIQNNGAIILGYGGINGATLTLQGSGGAQTFDLSGTGSVTMSGGGADQIVGATGQETLINDVGHTIQGAGSISNLVVVNNGTISGNAASGNTLTITPSGGQFVNNGKVTTPGTGAIAINLGTQTLTNNGTFLLNGIITPPLPPNVYGFGTTPVNGSIFVTGNFTNNNAVQLSGQGDVFSVSGVYNNGAGATTALNGRGDSLSVAGPVTNAGSIAIGATESAVLFGSNTLSNSRTGAISIAGGTLYGYSLDNSGTIVMNGTQGLVQLLASTSRNEAGGTITMSGNGDVVYAPGFVNAGTLTIGAGETFNEQRPDGNGTTRNWINAAGGQVAITDGTLLAASSALGPLAENAGTVLMNGSKGVYSSSGTLQNDSSGIITLAGSFWTQNCSQYTQSCVATGVPGNTLAVSGLTDNFGTIAIDSGNHFNAGQALINEAGGTLTVGPAVYGPGSLGAPELTGAVVQAAAVTNNGTMTIGGQLTATDVTNSGVLTLNGITLTSYGLEFNGALTATGSLTNAAGGRVILSGTGDVLSTAGAFINNGNLTVGAGEAVNANAGLANGGGTILVSGGTLTASAVDNAGTMTLSGANSVLTVSSAAANPGFANEAGATLTLSGTAGGQAQVAGTFNNNGAIQFTGTGDTLNIAGLFTNAGSVAIGASEHLYATGGVTNSGQLAFSGGAMAASVVDNSGAVYMSGSSGLINVSTGLTNRAAGSINLVGANDSIVVGTAMNNAGLLSIGGGETVVVQGALANSGAVTVNGNLGAGSLDNSGQIAVDSANGGIGVVGAFVNESGAQLSVGNTVGSRLSAGTITNLGTIMVSGQGSLGGGALANSGTLTVTGSNASASFNAASTNSGTLTVAGGAMSAAALSNAGQVQLSGATGQILTSGTFTNNGVVTIDTGSTLTAGGGYVQAAQSTAGSGTIVGAVTLAGGVIQPGSIVAATPGTLTIRGDFLQSGGVFNELIGPASNGILNVTGNVSLGSGAALDVLFAGAGPIAVGTHYTIADYGTLTGGSAFTLLDPTFNGGAEQWGISYSGGQIVLTAEAVVATLPTGIWSGPSANLTANGVLTCAPAGASCAPSGGLNLVLASTGNTLALDATSSSQNVTVNGLTVTAGTLSIAGGAVLTVGTSTLNNDTIALSGVNSTLNAGALTNTGTIILNGTGNTLNADLDNSGTITLNGASQSLSDSGVFNNLAGGTLAFTSASSSGTATVAGAFNNGGAVTMAGSGDLLVATGLFGNGGALAIGAGETLRANGGYVQLVGGVTDVHGLLATSTYAQNGGTTTVHSGGTISASGFQLNGGTVQGAGRIVGDVTNAGGFLLPGLPGTPGTLAIGGNYTQGAGGTLIIDLVGGGTGQSGVLDVSGSATLGGTIDFVALNGFAPTIGEDFTFLDYGSVSGDFATVEFTNFVCPTGATCTEVFGPNSVSLDIAAPTTAVPEPDGLALFAVGLAGLAAARRRVALVRAA